ncbi:MAG TPA: hypothetical protein VGG48_13455 [Rhizomicrobium sp.]|jgi:hypothetical protein
MVLKTLMIATAAVATMAVAFICPATAGGMSHNTGMGGGSVGGMGMKGCKTGGGVSIYKPTNINKSININNNVNINKNINVYKPVTIEKNINVYKPVTINKNIDINKNVNIDKNININKNIVINKGGGDAEAQAFAYASANANSSSQSASVSSASSYSDTTVINKGGSGEVAVAAEESCHMQEATVVKAIHVVCVTQDGREFPASHMVKDTWVESGYEGEVARCIPGATVKAVIGDVVQSDEGMAGTYSEGQVISCGMHEALRHYKDGMLKCAPAVPVKDCTERTNLRLYGTGDFFFSYRAQVCANMARKGGDTELTGMTMDGGVGN